MAPSDVGMLVLAVTVSACTIGGLIVSLVHRLVKQKHTPWTRFGFLAVFIIAAFAINVLTAVVQLVLDYCKLPELLSSSFIILSIEWNQGFYLSCHSGLDIVLQILASTATYAYFLMLYDRFTVFKLYFPGGRSPTVRSMVFGTGLISYIISFAHFPIINYGPDPRNPSLLQKVFGYLTVTALSELCSVLDLVMAFLLCRTAFSNIHDLRQLDHSPRPDTQPSIQQPGTRTPPPRYHHKQQSNEYQSANDTELIELPSPSPWAAPVNAAPTSPILVPTNSNVILHSPTNSNVILHSPCDRTLNSSQHGFPERSKQNYGFQNDTRELSSPGAMLKRPIALTGGKFPAIREMLREPNQRRTILLLLFTLLTDLLLNVVWISSIVYEEAGEPVVKQLECMVFSMLAIHACLMLFFLECFKTVVFQRQSGYYFSRMTIL
ncbi:hypothetical protein BJ742DRAFT_220386 [Cladochytrium replicatum]|nr:hypothetical protein BJ742DRAFT_220386 [Cladochytrium replicatum]